eukprot:3044735-Pyramimonas_sp.AAC.1
MVVFHTCARAHVPMCVFTDMAKTPTGIKEQQVQEIIEVGMDAHCMDYGYWYDRWYMMNGEYD